MNSNQIKYVYARDNKNGPITFAYQFDDANQRIVYNAARCGKNDNFNKGAGRHIATERLLLNRQITESAPKAKPNRYATYAEIGGDRYKAIAEYLRTHGVNF